MFHGCLDSLVSLPSWVRLGTILKSRQGYDLAFLLGKEHRTGPKVSMACHLETQIKQTMHQIPWPDEGTSFFLHMGGLWLNSSAIA